LYKSSYYPNIVAQKLEVAARQVHRLLETHAGNECIILKLWLDRQVESVSNKPDDSSDLRLGLRTSPQQYVIMKLFDSAGNKIMVSGAKRVESSATSGMERTLLSRVLSGEKEPERLSTRDHHSLIAAAPISVGAGKVAGAVSVQIVMPLNAVAFVRFVLTNWIPVAAFLLPFAALAGISFGVLTARWINRRLGRIITASSAWSRGDFSARAADGGTDEFSQLGHRLDSMAGELRNLVGLRQEIASLEERARLARDLHDTVKQQAFAASMQLGAALALLDTDTRVAGKHLVEADRLTHHLRQDLTAVIHNLRVEPGLARDLHNRIAELSRDWSIRNEIRVELHIDAKPVLSDSTAESLYRILQEGLSNVARHSVAASVRIALTLGESGNGSLVIADDGQGFDTASSCDGIGLKTMRERAELLADGTFQVESSPGSGTTVTVLFALDGVRSDEHPGTRPN
jgi:signal transduction histidine kinase